MGASQGGWRSWGKGALVTTLFLVMTAPAPAPAEAPALAALRDVRVGVAPTRGGAALLAAVRF